MKRRALGKGLRSLIPETPPSLRPRPEPAQTQQNSGLLLLDLDRIHPNLGQPRRNFDDNALEELARSIKREGVLQPVVVRPDKDDSYELIAGERRWRAAQLAGLLKVPAIVREVGKEKVLELALIENLQREDLDPIEEANAYESLINELGLTQQEVAQRVGKQRATVANALRLLGLPAAVQKMIQAGQLSQGHAKALASLANDTLQVELAGRIVKGGLSVRDAESLVKRTARADSGQPARATERDPNVVAAEQTLQSAVGTKVRIQQGKKGGRIELHFYSSDEMERVYELILGAVRPAGRAH
jgi:ParB family chromosome partitioning protein